jgi:glycerol kinase
LTGLATGFWNSLDDLAGLTRIESTFRPRTDSEEISRLRRDWRRALSRSTRWA